MKKLLLIFVAFVAVQAASAQDKLSPVSAPASPAAYIIGAQPSSVLAPKSFQALETALYSNFANGGDSKTVLPNNLALEFTPYWATDHGLTLDEYLYPTTVWEQLKRNASFSVATSQNFLLEDKTSSSALSFGFRNTLFFGGKRDKEIIKRYTTQLHKKEKLTASLVAFTVPIYADPSITNAKQFLDKAYPAIVKQLRKLYGAIPDEELALFSDRLYEKVGALNNYTSNNNQFQSDFNNIMVDEANAVKTVNKGDVDNIVTTFEKYIQKRTGFALDMAYASFLNFPTGKFEYSIAPRQSFWLTPTYNFENNMDFLKAMAVLRYEWYDLNYYSKYFPSSKNFSNNFDYGIALSAEFKKFSAQIEAVGRSRNSLTPAGTDASGDKLFKKQSDRDFQCVGTLSYKVTDQIALSYSLGDRFDTFLNQGKTLVSLLSLNFGFGGQSKSDLKTSK